MPLHFLLTVGPVHLLRPGSVRFNLHYLRYYLLEAMALMITIAFQGVCSSGRRAFHCRVHLSGKMRAHKLQN